MKTTIITSPVFLSHGRCNDSHVHVSSKAMLAFFIAFSILFVISFSITIYKYYKKNPMKYSFWTYNVLDNGYVLYIINGLGLILYSILGFILLVVYIYSLL